jgi:Protein of unknown function (DUF1587)./Protein of unknown function (DUF1592)./Protein of unknown function (DUF1595)./Protein of unknown function (DUF1588)./Protein of unknown function (DUF1585).
MGRILLLLAFPLFATEPASPPVRRLTHSQYNNTLRDLLGDQTRPADNFPQEDYVNGFKNQIGSQDISPLLADAYHASALKIAQSIFQGGADSRHLLPCKPKSAADSECAVKFVRQFGQRAFRRPLTAAEVDRYTALLSKESRRTSRFSDGAQLVVEAMLQSPKFLFRLEGGSRGYDVAGRLSYFLWDSMPDDDLLARAATGELLTAAGVEKAIRRMLADPRARPALDEFVSQWMRFDLVLNTVKDRAVYPQFTPELAAAMTEETRRLAADAVWENRNFMNIFLADYAFVNSDLATLYKLPPPAIEFDKVNLPPGSGRAGILGEAMFLAATSKPEETSPTVRGFAVREQFLCQIVPDPPPGVNSTLPPVTAEKPMSNRERLQVHLTNSSCAGCHSLMDTVGFGLEKFDAIGQFREKQLITFISDHPKKGEKPTRVSLPLDPRGTVSGIPNSDFASPAELGKILAAAPQCQECVVRHLFRYAYGRKESGADRPVIQKGLEVFRASQFQFKELMMFLAKSLAT